MAIQQKYSLDLIPNGNPLIVKCSQYDSNSRLLVFTMFNEGVLYEIPSGTICTIRGTKSDNKGFEYQCSYMGSEITAVLEQQMTMFAGNVECELRLANGNQILGTANFILQVEKTSLSDDVDISETEIPLFEQAIESAIEAKSSAEIATNSALQAQQSAQSVSQLVPSNEGNDGQVLTKQGNGGYWSDAGAVSSFNGRVGDIMPSDDDYSADMIEYNNTTTNLTATNVQTAIDELSTPKSKVSTGRQTGTGLTSTAKQLTSITLSQGTWLIIGNGAIAGTGTLKAINLSTNSTDIGNVTSGSVRQVAFNGYNYMQTQRILELTQETTIYLVGQAGSTTAVNFEAYIEAIQLY